jgi:hypothetical protein
MPKGNQGGEDRAKVKFRVIEFELEGANASVESSIKHLVHAISNRNGTTAKAVTSSKAPKELASGNEDEVVDAEVVGEEDTAEEETPVAPAKPSRARSKPKPPKYLPDLLPKDKLEEFKQFAATKTTASSSRRKGYLVAAFWMKEFGGDESVNADKIYTLFKTAGWPTNFNDWRSTFDNLVQTEHLRLIGKGEFAINPLGEDEVNSMA